MPARVARPARKIFLKRQLVQQRQLFIATHCCIWFWVLWLDSVDGSCRRRQKVLTLQATKVERSLLFMLSFMKNFTCGTCDTCGHFSVLYIRM